MGVRTGLGLKFAQFFLRGIIFGCAAVVLGIYSYFLATMHTHHIHTPTWVRAVEGLAGSATLYSLIGLLLLWCLAGHTAASFIAIVLDICFIAAFLYIAAQNRGGASVSCKGHNIRTPFGTGDSTSTVPSPDGDSGTIKLPSFRTACRLETACLAVAVIAIVFLLFAALTESLLARNHKREKKYGPGPNNNYTSGSGSHGRRLGPFGRRNKRAIAADDTVDPAYNADTSLPANGNGNGTYNNGTNHANGTYAAAEKPATNY